MYLVRTSAGVRFGLDSGFGSLERSRSSRRESTFQAAQAAYNPVVLLSRGFSCDARPDENSPIEAAGGGLMYYGLKGGSN